jgi:hypothetical protein
MNKAKKIIIMILALAFIVSARYTIWHSYVYYTFPSNTDKELLSQESKTSFQGITVHNKEITYISLAFLLSLILLLLILGTLFVTKNIHWWIIVWLISLFCTLEIGFLWYLIDKQMNILPASHIVFNKNQVHSFLKEFNYTPEEFILIPTGILIGHFNFSTKDNDVYPGAIINGYIWQKYTDGIHDSLERNILLPQMYSGSISEIFREKKGKTETIVWFFSGIFFQYFDRLLYPFEHHEIKIELSHKNFEKNVMCIPDFESYTMKTPQFVGLNYDIHFLPSHWKLQTSIFAYTMHDYRTNFGNDTFHSKKFPLCYFCLITKSDILDTCVMYLFLIFIIAILLFITLLTFVKQVSITPMLGYSSIGVLGISSALFFVLIANQINMRTALALSEASFLDYIYFIVYFFLVLVSLDSILFALSPNLKIIQFKNNIIPKMAYWPLLLCMILGITIAFFY